VIAPSAKAATKPIYLHGAMERITLLSTARHHLGELRRARAMELAGAIALCRHRHCRSVVAPLPDPVSASHRADARARPARQRRRAAARHLRPRRLGWLDRDHHGNRYIRDLGDARPEDALVHWAKLRGLKARPLAIVGYGDEGESDEPAAASAGRSGGASA
jgi:putative mRNA 3-end processing factor